MAEKRMFTKAIIDSDAFIDMPLSTQALYFHLSMRADDEGFINNPKKVMRMIGANQNELDILLAKRYLLSFDTGVVVIKHWKMHNAIRADRLKKTMYVEEKSQLITKENGIYTDNIKSLQPFDNQVTDKVSPSIDKIRLEENSIDKGSIDKPKKEIKHKHGEYKNVLLSEKQFNKLKEDWGDDKLSSMIVKLDEGIQMKGYKYKDHNLTIRKWESNEKEKQGGKIDKFKGEVNFPF